MRYLHLLKSTLALGHLSLVVCGAVGVFAWFSSASPVDHTVRLYGALSGANNGYGFFAPGVSSYMRATFTMRDEVGQTWTDTLENGHSREAVLRITSGVSMASYSEVRETLMQAWAASMFGRHPQAKEITVRLEVYSLPTMEQYRDGVRPEWQMLHEAVFAREQ